VLVDDQVGFPVLNGLEGVVEAEVYPNPHEEFGLGVQGLGP
jgi:hypothetical protein